MCPQLKEREQGGRKQYEEGMRKRRSSEKEGKEGNDDESSGYSSGDKEDSNIVYYKVSIVTLDDTRYIYFFGNLSNFLFPQDFQYFLVQPLLDWQPAWG